MSRSQGHGESAAMKPRLVFAGVGLKVRFHQLDERGPREGLVRLTPFLHLHSSHMQD